MSTQPTPVSEHMISTDVDGRIQLARSILNHREWCDDCHPAAADALAALDEKTIDEIAQGGE